MISLKGSDLVPGLCRGTLCRGTPCLDLVPGLLSGTLPGLEIRVVRVAQNFDGFVVGPRMRGDDVTLAYTIQPLLSWIPACAGMTSLSPA